MVWGMLGFHDSKEFVGQSWLLESAVYCTCVTKLNLFQDLNVWVDTLFVENVRIIVWFSLAEIERPDISVLHNWGFFSNCQNWNWDSFWFPVV
jgi:hypothetical protein